MLTAAVCAYLPAAAGYAAEPADVVYLGKSAGTGAAGEALVALAAVAPDADVTTPRHVLERFVPGAIVPIGAALVERCEGPPRSLADYEARLDQVYQATMDLQDSRPTLAEIRGLQPCLDAPADPSDLAYVPFLEGVLEVSDGDPEAANQAFRDVFAIHIDYPWDDAYPPDAHDEFSRALVDVARTDSVPLAVELEGVAEVWLDGRLLAGMEAQLVPGRHLFQIRREADAPLAGMALLADSPIRVADPGQLGLGGALEVDRRELAIATVAGLLRSEGPDTGTTFVVLLGEATEVWAWDPADGELDALSGGLSGPRFRPRGGRDPAAAVAPVLLGVGAGLSVAGGLMAGLGWADLKRFNADVEGGRIAPFPGPDEDAPEGWEHYQTWQRKVRTVDAGLGLLVGGGVTLAVAIPVGIAAGKARRDVVVGAQLLPAAGDEAGPVFDGFAFSLTIQ